VSRPACLKTFFSFIALIALAFLPAPVFAQRGGGGHGGGGGGGFHGGGGGGGHMGGGYSGGSGGGHAPSGAGRSYGGGYRGGYARPSIVAATDRMVGQVMAARAMALEASPVDPAQRRPRALTSAGLGSRMVNGTGLAVRPAQAESRVQVAPLQRAAAQAREQCPRPEATGASGLRLPPAAPRRPARAVPAWLQPTPLATMYGPAPSPHRVALG
jgi:hypothetical protein